MAGEPIRIQLPAGKQELSALRAGDSVLLSGPAYTMRDAGHMRAIDYLEEHGELPFGLDGQTLFYAGPTPAAAGRPAGPARGRRLCRRLSLPLHPGLPVPPGDPPLVRWASHNTWRATSASRLYR